MRKETSVKMLGTTLRAVTIALISTCVYAGFAAPPTAKGSHQPLQLKVVGTKIVDSNGKAIVLRGVNAASMEWTLNGEGHILDTVNVAIKDWHVNIIRLPLCQDRWFGVTPEQKDKGAAYQALVRQIVDRVTSQNCYILLDLHWNDAGIWGNQIGQHVMPDMNSVLFWHDISRDYRNEPGVLFDLYNEPHDVPWDVWLKGGMVPDRGARGRALTYQTPGMQVLLDTIRGVGANNVIVCGGLDWAYDMSGILANRELSDPTGNGVIYANHTYPIKGDTMKKWMAKMDIALKKIPIIVSEFGAGGSMGGNRAEPGQTGADWVRLTMDYIYAHNMNFTAWDLHPSAGPTLISNWQYTPTPGFGVPVKQALTKGWSDPKKSTMDGAKAK